MGVELVNESETLVEPGFGGHEDVWLVSLEV